jgi:hypothetical protein
VVGGRSATWTAASTFDVADYGGICQGCERPAAVAGPARFLRES